MTEWPTSKNPVDIDIVNYDLVGSGDYVTPIANTKSTQQIVIKVASNDDRTFTITLDWTANDGTVLYSQSPAEGITTTDAALTFNTGSNSAQVTITDESGAGQNSINGTINAH